MRRGMRWHVSIHEAGHAIVAHMLGLTNVRALFDGAGGITRYDEVTVDCQKTADTMAVVIWAGPVAETLVLSADDAAEMKAACNHTSENSDMARLQWLGESWGGENPDEWLRKAKDHARLILLMNFKAFHEAARRLDDGDRLESFLPPLFYLKPAGQSGTF